MGQSILTWLQGEALPIIAVALLVWAIVLAFKRSFTGAIVVGIIFIIAGGIAINPLGVTNFLGNVFSNILSRAG